MRNRGLLNIPLGARILTYRDITVLGLSSAPDAVPASPSAYDDEFTALSGWTTLGTPDISNVTDFPGHLHLQDASTGTFEMHGIYKVCPSEPFTVTVKINDYLFNANYQGQGLMLLEASPGKIFQMGLLYANGVVNVGYGLWTNRTSRSSYADAATGLRPRYFRFIVASSTDVTTQFSEAGLLFTTVHANVNPGFTVGNVGLFITGEDMSVTVDAIFDWIRFT